jgi:hypothetical protein
MGWTEEQQAQWEADHPWFVKFLHGLSILVCIGAGVLVLLIMWVVGYYLVSFLVPG